MADGNQTRVSVAAVMPGPKNGMTLMTERIVNDMKMHHDVRVADIGKGFTKRGRGWSIRKAIQSFTAGVRVFSWSPRRNECLYLVLNSHAGLFYNIWHALAGRCRGFRMIAHHHVWSYLSDRDWKMALLIRLLGRDAVHVVACPEMSQELETVYGVGLNFAFLTPGIIGVEASAPAKQSSLDARADDDGPAAAAFTIGMLSNLTMEKGVGDAIETWKKLSAKGYSVRLRLAGPITDASARSVIEDAIGQHPDHIEHVGPVYGDEKQAFYDSLNAFLFPTRYRNESWGIVLNEALMAGVPAITFRRGCTGYLVGELGGRVIGQGDDYAAIAAEQIQAWVDDAALWQAACHHALDRGNELRVQAERQLTEFFAAFENDQWPHAELECNRV